MGLVEAFNDDSEFGNSASGPVASIFKRPESVYTLILLLSGSKPFIMGDEPTQLDCAIFGQLSQVKWHIPESCRARKLLESKVNLYVT